MNDEKDEDTWTDTTRLTTIVQPVTKRARTVFVLEQLTGPGAPRSFQLDSQHYIIGRGEDADIQVNSPDLSRKHIQLNCLSEECHIQDLESRNGCYLNGVKIHAATLRNGDTLQLGKILFSFHEGLQ